MSEIPSLPFNRNSISGKTPVNIGTIEEVMSEHSSPAVTNQLTLLAANSHKNTMGSRSSKLSSNQPSKENSRSNNMSRTSSDSLQSSQDFD